MTGCAGSNGATAQVGDRLDFPEKVIYQRALAEREFSSESIHNDDYTRRQGYPGALVSAYVLCGYMSEPLVEFFGPSWFTSGEIALKFVGKGVQQGDLVRPGGTVREIAEEGDGTRRIFLDLWMDKPDGARPVVGTASALVGSPAAAPGSPADAGDALTGSRG